MSIFQNACKPKGLAGQMMVSMMNRGHAPLADWGFQHIKVREDGYSLDIGCGGGANVKRLLQMSPKGQVKGLDYSSVSVEASQNLNKKAVEEGRCTILQGDVMNMLFAKNYFHLVTAFETIYFWPDINRAFHDIHKILREDGVFLICNEANGHHARDEKWAKKIEGMTVYNGKQLKSALEQAGFRDIQIDGNEKKGWLCVTARK